MSDNDGSWIDAGRLFQTRGPLTAIDPSPNVIVVGGTSSFIVRRRSKTGLAVVDPAAVISQVGWCMPDQNQWVTRWRSLIVWQKWMERWQLKVECLLPVRLFMCDCVWRCICDCVSIGFLCLRLFTRSVSVNWRRNSWLTVWKLTQHTCDTSSCWLFSLSVCLSLCLSVSLSVYVYVYLSVCVHMSLISCFQLQFVLILSTRLYCDPANFFVCSFMTSIVISRKLQVCFLMKF